MPVTSWSSAADSDGSDEGLLEAGETTPHRGRRLCSSKKVWAVLSVGALLLLAKAVGSLPARQSPCSRLADVTVEEEEMARGNNGTEDDEPEGCCSWQPPHCGKVFGKCRGGIKQCEYCKGQWINPNASICERGHTAEKPLPRIWNYSSDSEESTTVKILSYNLYWWKLFDKMGGEGGKAGKLIKASAGDRPYDVMGLQECNQPYRVLYDAGMDHDYNATHVWANICIAWLKEVWDLEDQGHEVVAEDASWGGPGQNFGQRMAMWARLRHKETNETLFFMNHHGPLPLSSGGDWGGPETARRLLNVILDNGEEGDAVVFVGDFNSQLHSDTVRQVACRMNKILSGRVFGGVDHIYTNVENSSVVSVDILGHGGSDHNAMNAVFKLGNPRVKASV